MPKPIITTARVKKRMATLRELGCMGMPFKDQV